MKGQYKKDRPSGIVHPIRCYAYEEPATASFIAWHIEMVSEEFNQMTKTLFVTCSSWCFRTTTVSPVSGIKSFRVIRRTTESLVCLSPESPK